MQKEAKVVTRKTVRLGGEEFKGKFPKARCLTTGGGGGCGGGCGISAC